MKTTDQPPQIEPCRHMRAWVNALADGSLSGIARWYTKLHVADCPRCRAALEAFMALRARLRSLGSSPSVVGEMTLTPERRSALEAALDDVERKRQRRP